MWGTIIGAGISAIGSLFGDDDDEKVTKTEVDYVKMAENAERAGFNPLTAIRNGGSAGFTNTTHPGLSSMTGIGQAFGTIGNALMSFDPRADERAQLEEDMMRAQLNRIQNGDTRQSMWSMDVPTAAKSTTVNAAGQSIAPLFIPPGNPEVGNTTVTNPLPTGSGFVIDTRFKDAESGETRYGDIMQEVFGIGNVLADTAANISWPKDDSSTWQHLNPNYGGRGNLPKPPAKPKAKGQYLRPWGQ